MPSRLLVGSRLIAVMAMLALALIPLAGAEQAEPESEAAPAPDVAGGSMTFERLNELIMAVDEKAVRQNDTMWQLEVEDVPVVVVTDPSHDRMRIIVGIAAAANLDQAMLLRLLQANFDTALDARYAVARDTLWGTFIHPLGPLTDEQFLSGLGQTVNLARTFGSTFSSGALSFGGGDSRGLMERELIDRLLDKGKAI